MNIVEMVDYLEYEIEFSITEIEFSRTNDWILKKTSFYFETFPIKRFKTLVRSETALEQLSFGNVLFD